MLLFTLKMPTNTDIFSTQKASFSSKNKILEEVFSEYVEAKKPNNPIFEIAEIKRLSDENPLTSHFIESKAIEQLPCFSLKPPHIINPFPSVTNHLPVIKLPTVVVPQDSPTFPKKVAINSSLSTGHQKIALKTAPKRTNITNNFPKPKRCYAKLFQDLSFANTEISSFSDIFTTDIYLNKTETGYDFAIVFIPKANINIKTLDRHICFMVDCSCDQERLSKSKYAIYRALDMLQKGDTFNIMTYDSGVNICSNQGLKLNRKSKTLARHFLSKVKTISRFFRVNPGNALNSIATDPTKLTSAILLSNGTNIQNAIQNFTNKNRDIVVHSIALDIDKKRPHLKLLSGINYGEHVVAKTKHKLILQNIKKSMEKLMKKIASPIIKDVHYSVLSKDRNIHIKTEPKVIYKNEPFVVQGHTKDLTSFIIFIEGKGKDKNIQLKHMIDFSDAQYQALNSEWALENGYSCLRKYIQDTSQKEFLTEGKEWLKKAKKK